MSASTRNHPKGLYVLFFTEMWERFGYYLMLGIFSLYMLDHAANGGMGFDPAKKSDIYGTYLGLVYLTPFIGGLLADRILGYRKSIVIGGLLMAAGYLGLALPGEGVFYASLLLIILGNGFFKPNISALLGNLYNAPEYKSNKDAGYNIFYMGINIGAFVCNFVAAYMRNNWGWGWAFAAAGVGMLIGVVIFLSGTKHVKEADHIKPTTKEDMPLANIFGLVLLPVFVFGVIGWLIPGNIFGTDANDAFLLGCLPVAAYYARLYIKANQEDKRPIGALLAIFLCVIVFWAVFHQNGDALTVYAEDYTDREMPAAVASIAEPVGMVQEVNNHESVQFDDARFATYIDSLEGAKGQLEAQGDLAGAKEIGKLIGLREASRSYFANLPQERIPAQGQSLLLYSTELYQSINPFWVVILTPVVVGFFGWMASRGRKISTPTKIAIGLFITGLSTLVMVGAVSSVQMDNAKASSWWLIASYGVITVGELCLSPMGLSLVSKLSPPRLTALLMGGWFLSTAVGNKLSGIISGLWEEFGTSEKHYFFLINFAACVAATIALVMLLKWLNAVMREKNID
ncbi:MAG: peptide MFS transporter [Bacteroidota bacterium]|nr:peptide MFS transporter [Bacteroidota bacterium]MDX5429409.1 peptide MFS transporter [Bacteroidota bacterium]MDX5468200.1 peptide MFS transporter [Bacteroidota bacterium]